MSDYLAKQTVFSFDYNAILGVVTDDSQSLELAHSGSLTLNRPNKLHATQAGGYVNLETFYDGKTLVIFGKDANLYT